MFVVTLSGCPQFFIGKMIYQLYNNFFLKWYKYSVLYSILLIEIINFNMVIHSIKILVL